LQGLLQVPRPARGLLEGRNLASGEIELTPRACLVSVVLALPLAGCGVGSYKTVPVSGRVTLDSKPLAKATVMFVPVAGAPLPSSGGLTDDDGHYSLVLTSDSKTNGAVLGKHKVIIIMGAEVSANDKKPTFHKQLPERYNRKTTLECDVPPDGREDANFNLKSN
jgi:hypothetical protein